ncbi:MAG: DUF998 domain-containing protein [Hyphomonas sp.]
MTRQKGATGLTGPVSAGRAGIFSAVLFGVGIIGQGLLHRDYNQVTELVSALATYPNGWIQSASFVIVGCAMLIFSIGLLRAPLRGPGRRFGPALFVISSLGMIVAGFVPMQRIAGEYVQPLGHVIGALMTFLGAAGGLFISSFAFDKTPRFRGAVWPARLAGLAVGVLLFIFARLAMPEGTPFHAVAGVIQRVMVLCWLLGIISISQCLIRLSIKPADAA